MAVLLFTSQILYVQHRQGVVYTEGWEGLRVTLGQTFATSGGASSISMIAPMLSANFLAEIRAVALEQSEGESADPCVGTA